jgi:hypothetical protein
MTSFSRFINNNQISFLVNDEYSFFSDKIFSIVEDITKNNKEIRDEFIIQIGWSYLILKKDSDHCFHIYELDLTRADGFHWKQEIRDSVEIVHRQIQWSSTLGVSYQSCADDVVFINLKCLDDDDWYLTRKIKDGKSVVFLGSTRNPVNEEKPEVISAYQLFSVSPDLIFLSIIDNGWMAVYMNKKPFAVYNNKNFPVWSV